MHVSELVGPARVPNCPSLPYASIFFLASFYSMMQRNIYCVE